MSYLTRHQIDTAKAGLYATLIVRHPVNGRLYVNFDPEILQLIREAKILYRMQVDVPESARMVMLQEAKFKSYHDELTYVLREYERVTSRVLPVTAKLLQPLIRDLEIKLRPGMVTLTWTSMNIDAYKHHVHRGLEALDSLISKVNDLIENRIEKNLKVVSKTMLVVLPQNTSYSLDEFVSVQEQHVRTCTEGLAAKNAEVERAVEDLMTTVAEYPVDPGAGAVQESDMDHLRLHYNSLMYSALINSARGSLNALKTRVCQRVVGGFLFLHRPFFEVDVQLSVPSVRLSPSLDEIQTALNRAAASVLHSFKRVWEWGQLDVPDPVGPEPIAAVRGPCRHSLV